MSSRVDAGIAPVGGYESSEPYPDRITAREALLDPPVLPARDLQSEDAKIALLTPIEREIVKLTAQGMKDGQIAARLHIGEASVQNYLRAISDKLACPDRLELIVYAYWQGLA